MNKFKQEESILSEITSLYERRGYKRFKPTCFEEYSLYLDNSDFLIGKNVITFSGTDGKLLALRPDVTLSIVKHTDADLDRTEKIFYTDKVYRLLPGSKEYGEISQAGVEVIGKIDEVCQAEVIMLIADTLAAISPQYLIDLSHMGFTEGLIDTFNLSEDKKRSLYGFLKNKNLHDFSDFALKEGLSKTQAEAFKIMASINGSPKNALKEAEKIAVNQKMVAAVGELKNLVKLLSSLGYGDSLNIDFSIVNNADYYNGLIVNGYLQGVPRAVLSGGRYDKLLAKFNKKAGAIGFALYLGELERYLKYDSGSVDFLIVYNEAAQAAALTQAAKLIKNGNSVRLSRRKDCGVRYSQLIELTKEVSND